MLKPRFKRAPLAHLSEFQQSLVNWFKNHGKSYPWRHTSDPYAILISEIMLQQTRVTTVLQRGFYTKFLTTFPTPTSLAQSPDDLLLRTWEGLGYYRRARLLRDTARALTKRENFPHEIPELLALPGIGTYTANALRAFAFNLPAAVVDGNIARVLTRIFHDSREIDSSAGKTWLETTATQLAQHAPQRLYHSAIMELGQTHCKTGQPDCWSCPISDFCQTNTPELLPRKKTKTTITKLTSNVIFSLHKNSILLAKEQGTRRQGFWKLPERDPTPHTLPILESPYTITRYHVTLRIFLAKSPPATLPHEHWFPLTEINTIPISAPYRRAITHLLKTQNP